MKGKKNNPNAKKKEKFIAFYDICIFEFMKILLNYKKEMLMN